jgi:transposase InsO family protein
MLQPDVVWPAASTFGNILSRAGLTSPQKKRKRTTPCSEPFSQVTGPNQLWCMDFKGYFTTGDGKRCDPFTITDAHSRYLIRCQIVSRMDLSQVRAICEAAMREYGVPARIRTDNGAPFAGTGLLGLSKLSLGWMKLGIVHERIQAGRPQQNGRHERMHRTLKEDTTKPPAASLRAQQSRFDSFRYVFNNERA